MEPKFYVGIDVSKLTLDLAVLHGTTLLSQHKIENSTGGIKDFLLKIKQEYGCNARNTILCAEAMGIYSTFLQEVLYKKKFRFCQEGSLQIKLSMGITRGKNDAIDALRIAHYARRFYSTLKFWEPPRACILQLKELNTLRKKLLKIKMMLESTTNSDNYYLSNKSLLQKQALYSASLQNVTFDLKNIEKEMNEVIMQDLRLQELFDLVTSVPRVGPVVAREIIITTNEFKDIKTARQFASYAGIAPFEFSSGTSINRKARISSIANKDPKRAIHLAAFAFASPQYSNTFLGKYYTKKVSEGKNKMSVINAIRNKIVHRIFACVRDSKRFIEEN